MAQDLEARVKALEATVQELRDREAIRDLRYRYHEYVNEGKFADIASLFTAEGELDFAHLGRAKGKGGVDRFFSTARELLDASEWSATSAWHLLREAVHSQSCHPGAR